MHTPSSASNSPVPIVVQGVPNQQPSQVQVDPGWVEQSPSQTGKAAAVVATAPHQVAAAPHQSQAGAALVAQGSAGYGSTAHAYGQLPPGGVVVDDTNEGFFARMFGRTATLKLAAPDQEAVELRGNRSGAIEIRDQNGKWLPLTYAPGLQVRLRDGTTVTLQHGAGASGPGQHPLAMSIVRPGGAVIQTVAGDRQNDAAQETGLTPGQLSELVELLARNASSNPGIHPSHGMEGPKRPAQYYAPHGSPPVYARPDQLPAKPGALTEPPERLPGKHGRLTEPPERLPGKHGKLTELPEWLPAKYGKPTGPPDQRPPKGGKPTAAQVQLPHVVAQGDAHIAVPPAGVAAQVHVGEPTQ